MRIAVLGGGLAGLQLGRRLKERGADFVVLEAGAEPGGLCRTLRRGAYSWDLGPHAFYSRRPESMGYYHALPLSYARLERMVRVCHRGPDGRLYEVGYPFENGLADLPWPHRLDCLGGYLRAAFLRRGEGDFHDLREWIVRGLGEGIARHFMLPYNEKIWDCPLERISMDLVRSKIEPETPWRILRNSFLRGSVGRPYQARFLYPHAGAGALTQTVAASIKDRLRTGWKVSRLLREGAGWSVLSSDGRRERVDRVVSTIPIPELLSALDSPEWAARSGRFLANRTWFVAVGLKGDAVPGRFRSCQWVFFAGPEPFYRVSLMHNFSRGRPPVLVAEVTDKGGGPSGQELCGRVLAGLREAGMLLEEEVEFVQADREACSYPIQTLDLRRARGDLEDALLPLGISLLGRSGRWEYLNTDGVFTAVDEFLSSRGAELAG